MTDMTTVLEKAIADLGTRIEATQVEREKATAADKSAFDERLKAIEKAQTDLTESLTKVRRQSLPGVEVGDGKEKNKYSVTRMFKLALGYEGANEADPEYGYEADVSKEMHKHFDDIYEPEVRSTIRAFSRSKAINAASGAGGAVLISTEVQAGILPELEAAAVINQLGAQMWTGLKGNISWNRDLGGIAAAYIDTEAGDTFTATASTFGTMDLAPHVYIGAVDVTWKMMEQPAMALEPWIRSRLAYKIGLLKDISAFNGTGQQSQPRGLVNTSGFSTVSWTGDSADYTGAGQTVSVELMKMMAQLPEQNAVLPGAKNGWAAGPFVVSKLCRATDGSDRPLIWPQATSTIADSAGRIPTLLGKKLAESTQLNAAATAQTTETFWYGDWNQLIDANWGTLAFASSDSHDQNFRKALVTVRAIGAHDIGILQPKCFVRGTTFNAT